MDEPSIDSRTDPKRQSSVRQKVSHSPTTGLPVVNRGHVMVFFGDTAKNPIPQGTGVNENEPWNNSPGMDGIEAMINHGLTMTVNHNFLRLGGLQAHSTPPNNTEDVWLPRVLDFTSLTMFKSKDIKIFAMSLDMA